MRPRTVDTQRRGAYDGCMTTHYAIVGRELDVGQVLAGTYHIAGTFGDAGTLISGLDTPGAELAADVLPALAAAGIVGRARSCRPRPRCPLDGSARSTGRHTHP